MRPNWAAVSALAGAAAAVVALIAYLAPPDPPPQAQSGTVVTTPAPQPSSPDPVITRPSPSDPVITRPSPSDPVITRPSPPDPGPSPESGTSQPSGPNPTRAVPTLSTVRPGGCDEAVTALTAYRRSAGTTRGGQAAAARQTYLDLMGTVLDARGAVRATISRLAAEFQELNFRLTGMTGGDPNQVIADINTDIAELKRLCESS